MRHYYKSRQNQALILEMYFGWAQTRIFDVKLAAPRYTINEAMESQGVVGIDAESTLIICLIRVTLQFKCGHVHHLHILGLELLSQFLVCLKHLLRNLFWSNKPA